MAVNNIMISAADAKLQGQGNLVILREVRVIEEAILTIAKYNSTVDELLFKERSVIIYDSAGYPTSSYNYGKGLIAKNFKELEIKFILWIQNP